MFAYSLKTFLGLSIKGIFCVKPDNIQSSVHPPCQRWLDPQSAALNGKVLQVGNPNFGNLRFKKHFQVFLATLSC